MFARAGNDDAKLLKISSRSCT